MRIELSPSPFAGLHLALRAVMTGALSCIAAAGLQGCKSAAVTAERDFGAEVHGTPAIVHVCDFDLLGRDIHHEEGVVSSRPGPVGRIGRRISGVSPDREARARELVDLMADSIVLDLERSGLRAARLRPGSTIPDRGWLLRGVFTEVEEGNRVRRSLIGLGSGGTDVQVIAKIDDLSAGPPRLFYEVETDATSGKAPGAAPTLVLGPYGAAARFVMAGKDLDKNVKGTAARIAERIVQRARASE